MIMRTPRSMIYPYKTLFYFFFNDTATTEIYTLSLHDALPICIRLFLGKKWTEVDLDYLYEEYVQFLMLNDDRSEEHTSELQSHLNLVCRLLLEKKRANI